MAAVLSSFSFGRFRMLISFFMQSVSNMTRPKVTIVVPVYNVEAWIERCARSLFEQTLGDMEFIFVDDGSPDRSIDVVERVVKDYPSRMAQTRIVHQQNQGPLNARIHGMLLATGEFLGTVDADDWAEPETYATLYGQAASDCADCVIMGYQRDFADHSEPCHRVYPETDGRLLMQHLYRYPFELVAWGELLRNDDRLQCLLRQYYQKPQWLGVTMWEDVAVMMPYYYGARRISYCDRLFYHYNRANVSSALNTVSAAKARQALKVMHYLKERFKEDPDMLLSVGVMTLGAKNMLLGKVPLSEWRETERWCNSHIMRYTSVPLKVRIFFWLLAHRCNWAYWLYMRRH